VGGQKIGNITLQIKGRSLEGRKKLESDKIIRLVKLA